MNLINIVYIIKFYYFILWPSFIKKNFFTFIYFWETGRDRAQVGEGHRKIGTQNPKQAPDSELSAQSPTWGSNPQTVRSWPEVRRLTNWGPQAPPPYYSIYITVLKWQNYGNGKIHGFKVLERRVGKRWLWVAWRDSCGDGCFCILTIVVGMWIYTW